MIEHYYSKKKVILHYAMFVFLALLGFVEMKVQFSKLNPRIANIPFILYGLYILAIVIRRVTFEKPVVTIMLDRLKVDRINAWFFHRHVEILFSDIAYITTDLKKGSKIFFLKTKDGSEYKFSLAMLDATQEDIIEELKKYDKTLIDGGVFGMDQDNSLNMD